MNLESLSERIKRQSRVQLPRLPLTASKIRRKYLLFYWIQLKYWATKYILLYRLTSLLKIVQCLIMWLKWYRLSKYPIVSSKQTTIHSTVQQKGPYNSPREKKCARGDWGDPQSQSNQRISCKMQYRHLEMYIIQSFSKLNKHENSFQNYNLT